MLQRPSSFSFGCLSSRKYRILADLRLGMNRSFGGPYFVSRDGVSTEKVRSGWTLSLSISLRFGRFSGWLTSGGKSEVLVRMLLNFSQDMNPIILFAWN